MPLLVTLAAKVSPHLRLLSWAAYLASFLFICVFPSFDRRTEVEEHALVAGYARSNFEGVWPGRLQGLIRRFEAAADVSAELDRALEDAHLSPHRMNFTAAGGVRSSVAYLAVGSRRGDSREAVVLAVAVNLTAGKKTAARAAWGFGVGVALAEHLRSVPWLSKDVLILFVDSSLPYGAAVRAWLRAYFGGASALRRGVLRQALVLETSSKPAEVLLDVEGINGMLPNQDVVNTFLLGAFALPNLPTYNRESWDALYHHFWNGGVHSSHAPFLEHQVPAFTVHGVRKRGEKKPGVAADSLLRSLEAIVRSLSNNLQQLHHSFNFYYFTGPRRHVSNGIYLYPVIAMQAPLISCLMTTSAYRDIRSFLVGLGAIAAMVLAAGSPVFLLATEEALSNYLAGSFASAPTCARQAQDPEAIAFRQKTAAAWLSSGAAAAVAAAVFLRQYAFAVFDPEEAVAADLGRESLEGARRGKGVRLPSPLWDAVRSAAGFAALSVLAPLAIYSWSVAVPLTAVVVPVLVCVQPFDLRRRPLRSLLLLAFLACNGFLFAVRPEARAAAVGDLPRLVGSWLSDFYEGTVVPAVPREVRAYLPNPLVRWLQHGALSSDLSGNAFLALHELARDFTCVGGMLFPIFCFVYWPLLALLVLVGFALPAQRVEDEGPSLKQLRLGAVMVLLLTLVGVVGGVYWRSYSSKGLGKLEW